jgi:hypothetical protein
MSIRLLGFGMKVKSMEIYFVILGFTVQGLEFAA